MEKEVSQDSTKKNNSSFSELDSENIVLPVNIEPEPDNSQSTNWDKNISHRDKVKKDSKGFRAEKYSPNHDAFIFRSAIISVMAVLFISLIGLISFYSFQENVPTEILTFFTTISGTCLGIIGGLFKHQPRGK